MTHSEPNRRGRDVAIYLVRHGATDWSESGRHTGHTDVALNDVGKRQAEALGTLLPARLATVFTSPLQRARKTMELAGFSDGIVLDELAEWDYGIYEGRTTDEIRESVPEWSVWTHAIPQGESIDEVGKRADTAITRLIAAESPVAVFAHGHFLRILAARWAGLNPRAGMHLGLDTATLSGLGWERENRVIEFWNTRCVVGSDQHAT